MRATPSCSPRWGTTFDDFRRRAEELDEGGGGAFLATLEDQLSNVVRLTDREVVELDDVRATLDRLFETHCRG